MKFKLDPPSGHADSYLDIRFDVSFDSAEKAEVKLFNETTSTPLEILAVSRGFIVEDKIATIKNSSSIEGFINIFNKDKMNSGLNDYTSIDIKCELTTYRGSDVITETMVETFYNESKSLDSTVLPFDLHIHNPELNVSSNEPLKMSIISTENRFYELSIMNEQGTKYCSFEVLARKGKTDFALPVEVIFDDLELNHGTKKEYRTFNLFWSKFEGLDYSKLVNRKSIRIPDSQISIIGSSLMPKPQKRLGPVGELSSDFVLSDRYFVHTHKNFSGFGSKKLNPLRMKWLTMFLHESIDMNLQEKPAKKVISAPNINEPKERIKTFGSKKNFLNSFVPIFSKMNSDHRPALAPAQPAPSGGCSGCQRKK